MHGIQRIFIRTNLLGEESVNYPFFCNKILLHTMNALLVSSILFVLFDALFLWLRRKSFAQQIQDVQKEPLQMFPGAVIACYSLLILGLNYFIVYPRRPLWDAFFLGCFVNGVFETTNYSIFKKWQFETVVVDTLWGGVLFSLTTYLTYAFCD